VFVARAPCRSIVKSRHVVLNIAQELQCSEVVMIGGYNKKSELMLLRRATASVWFRTQVVLVYLRYISAKIHCKCASQPKIAKNHLKRIFLGFKVVQGHRCWYTRKARQQLLVIIYNKFVSICNHSRARLVDSSRNRTFTRGYPNLMRSYGALLEPRGSNLTPLKSTFNAKHTVRMLS